MLPLSELDNGTQLEAGDVMVLLTTLQNDRTG